MIVCFRHVPGFPRRIQSRGCEEGALCITCLPDRSHFWQFLAGLFGLSIWFGFGADLRDFAGAPGCEGDLGDAR